MKITKISIQDYLGIDFWKTDKVGKLNRITGGNGAGKSSILKAIREAFSSSGKDPHVIRVGKEKAEIFVWLDSGIEIQRRITPSANTVKVVHDGQPLDKPQTFLNGLLAPHQFNPVDFILARPKERRELLLSAMPFRLDWESLKSALWPDGGEDMTGFIPWDSFDFSKHGLEVLADIQRHVYERRHEQGIEVTRLKKSIEQDRKDIPDMLDSKKFTGFNLPAKVDELNARTTQITQHQHDLGTLEALRKRGEQILTEIDRLEREIKRLKAELNEVQARGKELKAKTDSFVRPDVESLRREITEYQAMQKHVARLEEIERRERELEQSESLHKSLDRLYKALTNEIPRKLLAEIKLPIDGLEIKGDSILVNGVELDKLSSSEQIKFSVEIARALAGELKVICVDRFETLDEDSRKVFERLAARDSFEYFMTVVTNGDLKMESSEGESRAEGLESTSAGKLGF